MMPIGTTRREDLCKKWFCAVKSEPDDVTRYLAFPMRCKSWDCPACRREKAHGYINRMQKLNDGRKLWFYTFTYFHSLSPREAWETYNGAWNRLRTNLSKKSGGFDYIRVLESHNDSPYPHIHVVMDHYFRPTVLGPAAIAAGFGYQLDCKPITSVGAFAYVQKYLTKEWKNGEAWSLRKKCRCRIVSFSRGLLSPAKIAGEWKQLIVGTTFERCLEHIRFDYEWDTNRIPKIGYLEERPDFMEVSIIWTDRPPTDLSGMNDSWQPDDWVPK